ncbi:YpiF family protein [Metabacillus halosaccharovorans]|uniref:YpiF family protein n=1 Tax=Metabacillus halosaccharovorans TaxID=930124 RepID=A0ABT3DMS3_9BACI|nr:YpiF family protein [Metabacillus halosaccharovorans]MCV9888363.1 YpiF family protein [Metabacillus halosaccharovorans]
MKWVSNDVDLYNQTKEYIDTAVVPLIAISVGSDFKNTVSKGEFINLVSMDLERQLKGRVFLFPTYSYLKKSENVIENLIEWKTELQQEFKHVVFLTSDTELKEEKNEQLEGKLIWLPTIPLENMDENLKRKLLQDQVEQILNILLQSWNKS